MVFAIGIILAAIGVSVGWLLGTGRNPFLQNKWDAVAGLFLIAAIAMMLTSICMLAWRYLP